MLRTKTWAMALTGATLCLTAACSNASFSAKGKNAAAVGAPQDNGGEKKKDDEDQSVTPPVSVAGAFLACQVRDPAEFGVKIPVDQDALACRFQNQDGQRLDLAGKAFILRKAGGSQAGQVATSPVAPTSPFHFYAILPRAEWSASAYEFIWDDKTYDVRITPLAPLVDGGFGLASPVRDGYTTSTSSFDGGGAVYLVGRKADVTDGAAGELWLRKFAGADMAEQGAAANQAFASLKDPSGQNGNIQVRSSQIFGNVLMVFGAVRRGGNQGWMVGSVDVAASPNDFSFFKVLPQATSANEHEVLVGHVALPNGDFIIGGTSGDAKNVKLGVFSLANGGKIVKAAEFPNDNAGIEDLLAGLKADPWGNYWVYGSMGNVVGVGSGRDLFVAKFNANLVFDPYWNDGQRTAKKGLMGRFLDFGGHEGADHVAFAQEGDAHVVYVAGHGFKASGDAFCDQNWILRKYTIDGEPVTGWEKAFAPGVATCRPSVGEYAAPRCVVVGSKGDVYVVGHAPLAKGAGVMTDWVFKKFSADGKDVSGEWRTGYDRAVLPDGVRRVDGCEAKGGKLVVYGVSMPNGVKGKGKAIQMAVGID